MELNKSVEMTQDILMLSRFSFPEQIPKWDAYFRLLRRFSIAEGCWGCRKWFKTHYSLKKGRTVSSGKIFLSLLSLDIHNRSQEKCLVSPVAISRAFCSYSLTNSLNFLLPSPLGLSSRGRHCSPAAGFAGESSPFCDLSVPAYSQWPASFCVFQPPMTNCTHAPETSILQLRLLNIPLFIMEEPRNPQTAFFYPQLPYRLTTNADQLLTFTAWQG